MCSSDLVEKETWPDGRRLSNHRSKPRRIECGTAARATRRCVEEVAIPAEHGEEGASHPLACFRDAIATLSMVSAAAIASPHRLIRASIEFAFNVSLMRFVLSFKKTA